MNQTRMFLLFAWIAVATLLYMEWTKEHAPGVVATTTTASAATTAPSAAIPVAPTAPTSMTPGTPTAPGSVTTASPSDAPLVTVNTDVLRLTLDGGTVRTAQLLRYPTEAKAGSPSVQLLDAASQNFFEAQSGWVASGNSPAPSHVEGFVPAEAARSYTMQPGAKTLSVPFTWTGANGVTIRRTYTFTRGDYAIQVRDDVANNGSAPWQGYVYRQLERNPPPQKSGYTNPEALAFHGAAWYSPTDKYEKRKYADFVDDGTLDKKVTGGWIALLQHYFFTAWIPADKDEATFSLSTRQVPGATNYLVTALGPGVNVAPGAHAETSARLWVGPKLVEGIEAQHVPGLTRAVDFSSYSLMATLAGWLFAIITMIHGVLGNWGWSIIGLVVLIRLAMYPIAAKQFQSMAKMRKLAPRMQQLKERYGDDRQKLQMATMELYKKEKVNPAGGCLPMLIQMPIFLALYCMLSE